MPDTLDGRYDLIVLHLFLLLHRLRGEPTANRAFFGQALIETHFNLMDQSLREMGVGDMGVGRRVKTMADAFYGRLNAYTDAANDKEMLATALSRNVYGTGPEEANHSYAALLAEYALKTLSNLQSQPADSICRNTFRF